MNNTLKSLNDNAWEQLFSKYGILNVNGGKETHLNISGATQAVKLSLPDGVYFAKTRGFGM